MDFCPADATRLVAASGVTELQLAASLARRFRMLRRLGAGGMGSVFLAEQMGVGNRPVALKVLSRRLLDDSEFLTRFQNEAGSTGRISHPNVVTIHESGQADDGTPYIVMEYLQGESLREALQRRGALPLAECAEILQQVARGLNAAHKLGIIHRDLKPDNIFLTPGEDGVPTVKIVDFGIAKLREAATNTATGVVLGTPAYMSSEQASGMRSEQLDARSDVYSLGVVVYEMLSGRLPFHSDTPLGYLRKHMLDEPPPLRAVLPAQSIPAAVEACVMKALAKERDRRYSSALEFAREFGQAVSGAVETTKVPVISEGHEPGTLPLPRNWLHSEDQQRAERERLAREEAERQVAGEKAKQEQIAQELVERERAERERAEQERRAQQETAQRSAEESGKRGQLNKKQAPLVLHPSKLRLILLLLVCLVFVVGGVWAIGNGEGAWAWGCLGFGLLGAVFFFVQFLPGASYLYLGPEGFVTCTLFRKQPLHRWDEVSQFGVAVMNGRDVIVFNVAGKSDSRMAKVSRAVFGGSHMLPDTYGLKAKELAALMNKWRAQFG